MAIDAIGAGLAGIQRGVSGLQETATSIARAGTTAEPTDTNLTEALVDLQVYEQVTTASARVVQVADETLGTLLDEKV